MKYIISIGIGVVFIALLVWFFAGAKDDYGDDIINNNTPQTEAVHTEYGFSYTYLKDEYTLYEPKDAARGDLVFTQSLMDTDAYRDLVSSDTPREGPVALSMSVYRNPMNKEAREWITQTDASNYHLSSNGTIQSVQMGSTTFLAYQFDGLYRTDAYVYGKDGYVYVFFNMWDNPESAMKKDMEQVLSSLQFNEPSIPASSAHGDIFVSSPEVNEEVSSPLVVEGKARGGWFFEATFPIVVVDWDGRIIGEGYAEAQGEWMTEELVPFVGEVQFQAPPSGNDRGALILKKSNASGLPEHDDAIEIPVRF